ncbi:MAG TPA: hypothetical protein VNU72_03240 [Puia sp.]|jgi:hypothetical protein|nr:hypothetical protein [Puia sp.]
MTRLVLPAVLFLSFCHILARGQRPPGKDTFLIDPSHPRFPPPRHNPEFRTGIKKEAVAEYREKTGHPGGDFIVRLFQTSKTMYFRAEVEFEGLPGKDTIRLPDLGTEPHPVLQKGETKYSCIIGFLDNDHHFREVKGVIVSPKENQFRITTLRHWAVTTHYRLVSQ